MLSNILLLLSLAFADGEYTKHESNLVQINGQIATAEKNIRDAIDEKNKTTNNARYHELIAEIKENLNKRKENIKHFNKEYHHTRYEHPEKSEKLDLKYKRYDEKAINEFEDEINKLLSNVKQNVKKKYNP